MEHANPGKRPGRVPLPESELFILPEFRLSADTCRQLIAFNQAYQQRNLAAFLKLKYDWQEAYPGKTFPGVCAVVADSFARIFFRNMINQGLPAIECPGAAEAFGTGDEVQLDLGAGALRNLTRGTEVTFKPLPPFIMEILEDGGLVPHLKRRLHGGGD